MKEITTISPECLNNEHTISLWQNEIKTYIQTNGGSFGNRNSLLLSQQFAYWKDFAQTDKSKILVVQYHPFGTLFQRKVLISGKELSAQGTIWPVSTGIDLIDIAIIVSFSCWFQVQSTTIRKINKTKTDQTSSGTSDFLFLNRLQCRSLLKFLNSMFIPYTNLLLFKHWPSSLQT